MIPRFVQSKAKKLARENETETNPLPVSRAENHRVFVGLFTGLSVEVFEPKDIKKLYNNGFFGCGAQTKTQPRILIPISRNSKTKTHTSKESNKQTSSNERQHFIDESLVLSLEESFFLQNALKCLEIRTLDEKKSLSANEFLSICCSLKKNFVMCYVAYHYYRSQEWIVKSGLKFGGDFLLYYKGPKYYHASYVVLVRNTNESTNLVDIQSNYRVAETASKELIILYVRRPNGIDYNEPMKCIENLDQFTVNELRPKRFAMNPSAQNDSIASTSADAK